MISALVGLFGVIFGGFLTNALGRQVERVKYETTAANAGFVLSKQLLAAARRLQTAAEQREWWTAELSPEPIEPLKSLGSGLRSYINVSDAFTEIQTWHAKWLALGKDKAPHQGALSAEQANDLMDAALLIEKHAERLDTAARRLRVRQLILRRIGQLAIVACLLLVAFTVAVPREHNTPKSVADQLAASLGPNYTVDCDPDGEDLICQAVLLAGTLGDCQVASHTPTTTTDGITNPVSSQPGVPSCAVQARMTIDVHATDTDLLVAAPRAPPTPPSGQAASERPETLASIPLRDSHNNLLSRLWKGIIGSNY